MSRIGRKPIPVPTGVKINTGGGRVEVQGPKGKLFVLVPSQITGPRTTMCEMPLLGMWAEEPALELRRNVRRYFTWAVSVAAGRTARSSARAIGRSVRGAVIG